MSPQKSDHRLFHVPAVQPRCRMLLLGLGGAGGSAVSRMTEDWPEGPDVVAMNTDTQALGACTVKRCVPIGPKVAQGMGAAADVTVGRLAAEESQELIQEVIGNHDVVFLVVGLGGGTGTGAAPVICQVARNLGILTLVFATMPFPFEGDRRRRQAEEGLRTLQQTADAVVCLPNQRLLELVDPAQTGFEDAFRHSDRMIGEGVHGLWRLLAQTGVINLDLSDVRQLAERSGGSCAFAHVEAEGPARTSMVLKRLLESPLLDKGRLLAESAGVLVNITGGPDLTLADVQGLMGQITSQVRPGAHRFMGAIIEPTYRNRIALTVLTSDNWLESKRRGRGGSSTDAGDTKSGAAATSPGQGAEQGTLDLETYDKGRFSGVDPTYIGGQDLDIPTFVRRGVRLSFEN